MCLVGVGGAGNGSQQHQLAVAQSFWWLPQGGLQISQIQLEKGENERCRGTEAEHTIGPH